MKQVLAEQTSFIYVGKDEDVRTLADSWGIEIDVRSRALKIYESIMRGYINETSDVRAALFSLVRPTPLFIYYLHWNDGTDLDVLDKRVENGTYTDQDFVNSIKTEFHQLWCTEGHIWDTLNVPGGDPYVGAPGLMDKKEMSRVETRSFKTCPICNSTFRQRVAKVFNVYYLGYGKKPPVILKWL